MPQEWTEPTMVEPSRRPSNGRWKRGMFVPFERERTEPHQRPTLLVQFFRALLSLRLT